jgi:hypothetical protein
MMVVTDFHLGMKLFMGANGQLSMIHPVPISSRGQSPPRFPCGRPLNADDQPSYLLSGNSIINLPAISHLHGGRRRCMLNSGAERLVWAQQQRAKGYGSLM